jgi:hypothetical protein
MQISMDLLSIILISSCFISTLCAILALILSIYTQIEFRSSEKSTHKLEYVPMDPSWGATDKEINEINERSEIEFPDIDTDELGPGEIDLNKMI